MVLKNKIEKHWIMKFHSDKIINVKTLVEKYDLPTFGCIRFFYDQYEIKPCLAVILTNNDPGSISYSKGIRSFCKKNIVEYQEFMVHDSAGLLDLIEKLNYDDSVHGIMVMYPSGYDIKDSNFMNAVNPSKDVEGLHHTYLGYLAQFEKFRDPEQLKKLVIPPTAKGIISIIKRYAILYDEYKQEHGSYPDAKDQNPFYLEAKRVTIINDSLAVGRTLALMMLNENAYVQVCHKYTPFDRILSSVSRSDFIISAVPSNRFVIPAEYVPTNSIVIDISFEGNFEYPHVVEKCYKIAPRWDLTEKGNRINDMTLNRLISNLFYLINSKLPKDVLKNMTLFE